MDSVVKRRSFIDPETDRSGGSLSVDPESAEVPGEK